ncbi:DUF2834 domain-containing protein [Agromyces aureus]|uniref:DUF2834 domain-containing protein n=1 Tax=Agromyces aureus TaxID=453304 RepID=A0A191WD30_9MICO|nr:DUF2834 domain-containing protein [Agromyces aureus]ANJ26166.1 hypothetical protein ATC03_04895 [Agromyces aureus]
MRRAWTPLAITYLVISVAGLVGAMAFNVLAAVQMVDFLAAWFANGPAVSSLTVDLLGVAVAGSILIVVEARRLGMRFSWLYVVGSLVTAFTFTFPLFLAMRERHLATVAGEGATVEG